MFNKIKSFGSEVAAKIRNTFKSVEGSITSKAHKALAGTKAEAYVDTGVKILIAVVIGALLLAGLYALFNTTIMPTVTQKVNGLFNYSGT